MPTQEHQTKISGYRELSEQELALVNAIKAKANELGDLVDLVSESPDVDPRSWGIARTHLQTGLMWLIRSITRPTGF